jgi:single-strand DNA-binding protein
MSRGYNRVVLMGNVARDPDIRTTPGRYKAARISVACSRQWKDRITGEKKEACDFVPVVLWGALADLAELYVRKGRPVLVEGRLSVRAYDDPKTGQKHWITEVAADSLVLISSGKKEPSAKAEREPAPAEDVDIPF